MNPGLYVISFLPPFIVHVRCNYSQQLVFSDLFHGLCNVHCEVLGEAFKIKGVPSIYYTKVCLAFMG